MAYRRSIHKLTWDVWYMAKQKEIHPPGFPVMTLKLSYHRFTRRTRLPQREDTSLGGVRFYTRNGWCWSRSADEEGFKEGLDNIPYRYRFSIRGHPVSNRRTPLSICFYNPNPFDTIATPHNRI